MPADEFSLLKRCCGIEEQPTTQSFVSDEPTAKAAAQMHADIVANLAAMQHDPTLDSFNKIVVRGTSKIQSTYAEYVAGALSEFANALKIPPEVIGLPAAYDFEPVGDPMKERRFQTYRIDPIRLLRAARDLPHWKAVAIGIASKPEQPIPDDAIFVDCCYDHSTRMFEITLAHESFPRVPDCARIPFCEGGELSLEVTGLNRIPDKPGLWLESTRREEIVERE